MGTDFTKAEHTLVVSDIHLSDAEPAHPKKPLWKRYKRAKHFIDKSFKSFLETMSTRISGPIELVLNGDIFDFDSVGKVPLHFRTTWLERKRGLAAEEPKSRFKIGVILADHPVWVEALREFVERGNRVVFIIGNHDMELHWPSVRQDIVDHLKLTPELRENIRFCEWFYLSNQDTLIEHGNQYDAYCLATNPIHPLIKKGKKVVVRLPFGNLAGKYMVNGMGLLNPHVDSSFIKSSLREYFVFYLRYVVRIQPGLFWTWLWGAFVTLVYSLSEGVLPAMRDPLMAPTRVADIAARANASPVVVWSLREIHAHPAIFNPFKILRELWLDRAILFLLIVLVSFQFFSTLNVFMNVSVLWFFIPMGLLLPVFVSYAQSVESELDRTQNRSFHMSPVAARISRVERVIHGHIHHERHTHIDDIEYLNTGTWSPAFHDVECTQPFGKKCFAWIRPSEEEATEIGLGTSKPRVAGLFEWQEDQIRKIALEGKQISIPDDPPDELHESEVPGV
ncbi:MAG: hypothetical protein A2070_12065 [Bdellovibrionales bacterium GWC1_52_8]|nr:MAG: hypothetical protein A2X97_14755 [Bdellovibrionales bacterium GWA1_52_35]OFZ42466.1 MAG: hypothetical protein A2070_12065 [Bdellovibrionales bacterium GWC1_52_8]HCM39855.1 hypothetical protein [Bdellovibrionales bacterium]